LDGLGNGKSRPLRRGSRTSQLTAAGSSGFEQAESPNANAAKSDRAQIGSLPLSPRSSIEVNDEPDARSSHPFSQRIQPFGSAPEGLAAVRLENPLAEPARGDVDETVTPRWLTGGPQNG